MRIKLYNFLLSFIFIVLLTNVFILSPFYHSVKVKAHEISEEPWLLINNEDLLEENTDPEPASLISFEHTVSKTFEVGKDIQLTLVENQIKETFHVSGFETHWSVWENEKQGNKNFEGNSITLKFDKPGVYGVSIAIESNGKLLTEKEDFVLFVGTVPSKSNIKVNGVVINKEINISRDDFVKFAVDNPNPNYKYVWDLGDEIKNGTEVEKLFESTKMPLYIFLRTLDQNNVYSDSFIKLDSNELPKFKVNTPYVQVRESESKNQNIIVVLVVLGTVIIVIVFLYIIFRILNKKKSGKIGS